MPSRAISNVMYVAHQIGATPSEIEAGFNFVNGTTILCFGLIAVGYLTFRMIKHRA